MLRRWFPLGTTTGSRAQLRAESRLPWVCGTLDVAHVVGCGFRFSSYTSGITARLLAFCLVLAGAVLVPAPRRAPSGPAWQVSGCGA
jgi:hypothetical protein